MQVVYESLVVYNDKSQNEITDELNLNQQKRLEDSIKKSSHSPTISDSDMQQEIKKWSSK